MIRQSTLSNGVRVVTEATPSRVVAVGIWVEVGARDEHDLTSGCSHFVEHMMFKGTGRRDAHQIAREFDVMGGTANAFTSTETTCYHATVLAERLPQLLDLLGDITLGSLFASEEVENEREVILQEIAMVEDTPDDLVHDLFNRRFWGRHSLGHPVLGPPRVVGAMSASRLQDFHRHHYTPNRLVIAAAGQVEHQTFHELCERYWGAATLAAPEADRAASVVAAERRPPGLVPVGRELVDRDLEQAHLVLGVPALPENDPDRYALHLLNTVLGGNMSSRLFQEIREKRGLAYSVFSYVNSNSDSGLLAIYLGTDPRAVNEALEVVGREVKGLTSQEISPEVLAEARDYARAVVMLAEENMESRMTRLARNLVTHGRPLPLEEILAGLDRVTPAELLRLAGRLFAEPMHGLALAPMDHDELAWDLL